MNIIYYCLPYVAQEKPIVVVNKRKKKSNLVCVANKIIRQTIKDMATGVKQ